MFYKLDLGIEIKVKSHQFHLKFVVKEGNVEKFFFDSNNEFQWCLIAYEKELELFLSSKLGSDERLNVLKGSLVDLYNIIRNHPSGRLRMLNLLGPIKQY